MLAVESLQHSAADRAAVLALGPTSKAGKYERDKKVGATDWRWMLPR
jgi:hypothetical protein